MITIIWVFVIVLLLAVGGSALAVGDLYFYFVGRRKLADWTNRNLRRLRLSLQLAGRRLTRAWLGNFFEDVMAEYRKTSGQRELGLKGKEGGR